MLLKTRAKRHRRALFPSLLVIALVPTVFTSDAQKADTIKISLLAPTGQYAVGRQSIYCTDNSRPELHTDDPGDHREMMVHVWYPAERPNNTSASPYIPDLDLVKSSLDDSQYSILSSVLTNTFANAKWRAGRVRYPVLIFSHGNQMCSFLYTAIIENLASHGYVVVTIDHPYEAIFTVFPDRRVVAYSEDRRPKSDTESFRKDLMRYLKGRINDRASDIVFVINRLVKLNSDKSSQLRGRLDLASIGVFGHSNGGTAAAQACLTDSRIKACINLDGRAEGGPFYPSLNGKGPEQPLMYLAKPLRELSDQELAEQKITRERFDQERANTLKRENELMKSVKSGSYRVIIKGATHESFSDEPLLTGAAAPADKHKTLRIVREYTLAFFDRYLRNKTATTLDTTQYPEVTVERFGPGLRQ